MDKENNNQPRKRKYVAIGVERGQEVEIQVNGKSLSAFEGETIGAVLAAYGIRQVRTSQHRHDSRGLYCGMGLCHECLVTVDGQPNLRACLTPVQNGQQVTLQDGFGQFKETLPTQVPVRLIRKKVALTIIGAGPAGLNAAIEAARMGTKVLIVDEYAQPGGQIYRQLPVAFHVTDTSSQGSEYADGHSLLERVAAYSDRITIWTEALVWSVFEPRILAVERNGELVLIESKAIVVATGAYDRPVPVSGWTMPGVMTTGGAQVLLKSQRVIPGRRVLLAGSGPLQLVVAYQMLDAGIEISAVVESASMDKMWRYLPDLLRKPDLLIRGCKYLHRLKQARVPFLKSHVLTSIRGEKRVHQVVLSELDRRGRLISGHQKTLDADTVCIGYGLIPHTGLTRLIGCSHIYDALVGGWIPRFDADMQTDQVGVFVAGDGAGVAGVLVASQQGKLAGLCAAAYAEDIPREKIRKSTQLIRKSLYSLQKFRRAMDLIYQIQPSLYASITDETLVCRCEEVTAGEIRRAIREGTTDINDIKKRTRVGMGYCQGINCLPTVAAILSGEFGVHAKDIMTMTPRPPLKPIPLGMLMVDVKSDNLNR